jgi:tetratricopeptide (TPR) repeat protein
LALIPAGRLQEAKAAAEKGLSLDPALETGYTTLAMVYDDERDWRSLLSLSQRLQKLNPKNYLGWYYAGVAQAASRETESDATEAVQSFRHALKLSPSFPLAHYQLGKLFWEQGNNQASIEELSHAIQENPGYVEAHFLLAKAYSKAGNVKRSQEEFEIHRKLVAAEESRRRPHLEVKINPPK